MKRYRFRLENVRRVRRIELDRAAAEVARARHELTAAQRRTAERQRAYRECCQRPAGASAAELRGAAELRRLAAEAVGQAQAAEHRQEQVVAARLTDWSEADKRVRLLDQLDERSRARHAAELLHEEQQVLDDLVTSRQGRDA